MANFDYLESIYTNISDTNFSLTVSIFSLVMYCLLLKKANESGWKILIPYYGEYTIFKIAKKKSLFWWQLMIGIITTIVSVTLLGLSIFMLETEGETAGLLISSVVCSILILILSIALIIINVKRSVGLAKVFGQTTAFGIGILFLEPIFIAIMALNKDIKYIETETSRYNDFSDKDSDFCTYENQFDKF